MGKNASASPPSGAKICVTCGRRFSWRRVWKDCWEQVKYCSTACQRRGIRERDREAEQWIRQQMVAHAEVSFSALVTASCSLKAAHPQRTAVVELTDSAHSPRFDEVTLLHAVRRLAAVEVLTIWVKGKRVTPEAAKGDLVLKRGRSWSPDCIGDGA